MGKMSGLWSGTPLTIRLQDLEVICTALACQPCDLLVPQRRPVRHTAPPRNLPQAAADRPADDRRPNRADGAAGGQVVHEPATGAAGHRRQAAPAHGPLPQRLVPRL
ncbi:helix-turn-helix transcriptional regulator [Streptomyces sp. NPDC005507]|uniref:helix-turn-helix domain-containing protein n=1 Tax=Streptomyces sp. NPDC005507 TaxID=3154885 RepID=UPI0033AAB029